MTTALLDPRNADRLCKLLGLLSSNHDGEVLAAARKADGFLRTLGLTWRDVIAIRAPDWRHMARSCREQAHRLSPKEFDFINNVALSLRDPTPKQLKWLRDIFTRLGGKP
jgi:hypothetical protein